MKHWARELGARGLRKFLVIIFMIAAAMYVGIFGLVLSHGFPISLMDINDDGFISPNELLNSIELWHRHARAQDGVCTEIFRLKDGMPVKVVSEES